MWVGSDYAFCHCALSKFAHPIRPEGEIMTARTLFPVAALAGVAVAFAAFATVPAGAKNSGVTTNVDVVDQTKRCKSGYKWSKSRRKCVRNTRGSY